MGDRATQENYERVWLIEQLAGAWGCTFDHVVTKLKADSEAYLAKRRGGVFSRICRGER